MTSSTLKTIRNVYRFIMLPVLCMLITTSVYSGDLQNQLINHASPYLAMHGNDPVQWQDWDQSVIDRAIKENKLIFISSGYFACHWCHVMQRESYSDPQVAAQLHKLAIPVKIDRELQPALDAWLIEFTQRTTGQGGWPLNVFLTPDGYPLVGLTYRPKDNFIELLTSLQQRWDEDETGLINFALNAFKLIQPKKEQHAGFVVDRYTSGELSNLLIQHTMQIGDDIAGGFGEQNKFPMSPQLLALLDIHQRHPNQHLADFLKLTLDKMSKLGLYDHVGGGFYRYVTDPDWETPHFEKMLYDNAQLVLVYLRASEIFNQPAYQAIALSTLDFVIEMLHQHNNEGEGTYAASLSAVDNKGIEGGYYLWSDTELENLLNKKEHSVSKIIWGTQTSSTLESGHHIKIAAPLSQAARLLSMTEAEIKTTLSSAVKKLKLTRTKRNIPIDTKVLAGWNGLLLSSFSEAVELIDNKADRKRYQQAASKLYAYLANKLWDGKQMHRFLHQGKTGGQVSLEDYAYVASGMLAWAKASNEATVWKTAQQIAEAGLNRFHNENGWQLSEQLLIPYDARELVLPDHTMPSPSTTLLKTLLSISLHNKDKALEKRVTGLIETDTEGLKTSPLWNATHIALISSMLDEKSQLNVKKFPPRSGIE